MNRICLTGRLTKEPDIKYSTGEKQMCIARFCIAVNRKKNITYNDGKDADFINCVALGKTGEFVEKYFHKGMKADLSGRLQTGSFKHKDGYTVYTTDVMVEEIDFGEARMTPVTPNSDFNNGGHVSAPNEGGFMDIPSGLDEEIPFV